MRRIPHRELRNNSSQILDDVKNGEVIEGTILFDVEFPPVEKQP